MLKMIASFFVIEKGKQSLLVRETAIKLDVLRLGLQVNHIEELPVYPKWKGDSVKLAINPDIKPVQQPMRRIPIALEEKVREKIQDALRRDIIEPVNGPSAWISPMILVFKENGDIRLCLDMWRANQAILRENHPLPTFEAFMTQLRDARYFSRLDLKDAYHQLELHEQNREITTFITPLGLFRYKRLMFGVNSAPEIFQRRLEQLLSSSSNVVNYIDDIIVFGKTEDEHDEALKRVRGILNENNAVLNEKKSVYKASKLHFLGHILSNHGIEADPEKINTITSFRPPKNKEESFLGLVNYVGKFSPELANKTDPLRRLLRKDEKFIWGVKEHDAFDKLKSCLTKIPNLQNFNPKHKTQLIAVASPVALGAVLLQFHGDDEPKIISFASRSMTDVEKRYSQTEKESLALVWAVEKFFYYLAGLEFERITDHKPLETIFKPSSKPPARSERWLLRLQAFKFIVKYKTGNENIADTFSRLCRLSPEYCYDMKGEHSILHVIENATPSSMTITEIAEKSIHDEEIVDAMSCLQDESWNTSSSNSLFPFRHELSLIGSIMLRGTRLVIPSALKQATLTLAHEGHPGESAMKRRLRSKVWWPQMDRDAEKFVKACRDCIMVSQASNPTAMKRTTFPEGPWIFVATDLLGPLPNNEHILVLIDYYSRYMEYKFLTSISSMSLISAMKEIFTRVGYPKKQKTDNGRQLVQNLRNTASNAE
ncbi:uncharacterized protein K02A2.6-like [Drosophila sulfurigaster albostrigata]|uniref:uncharacterized protein K02A2.6-like n=1 Tax=Drosophila sulfurigaster albostrigata TaxID=89887 RepID=UPI002D21899B|nr:uncharacterized protein K02A2.6-like [Drosophila sulfurigaster albostrigata]